jgi:hypothetical protein
MREREGGIEISGAVREVVGKLDADFIGPR